MVPENPAAALATLKQAFSSLSDLCLHSFNHLQHKWSHINQQYNLTATTLHIFNTLLTSTAQTLNQLPSASDMQQKWTRIDAQYNLTSTTLNIFNQSTHFFNNKVLTAETAAPFLITVLVLIVCAFGLICLYGFVGTVIRLLYLVISSIVTFLFKLVLSPVLFVVWCLRQCLWFGGKSKVKMMKAPGKPAMKIARTKFEANPREYFSNHRGRR